MRAWHAGVEKFMRRIAALSIAILLALPAPVLALDDASSTTQRNPIVWLLEDIGGLLKSAAHSIQTPTTKPERPETAQPQVKDVQPTEKIASANSNSVETGNSLNALFNDLAKLFQPDETLPAKETPVAETVTLIQNQSESIQKNEAVDVGETAAVSIQKNPIASLFSNLAELLTPTLEIDDQPSPQKVTKTIEIAPVPEETIPSPIQRNPISWLLSDLATMLVPENIGATSKPLEQPENDVAIVLEASNVTVEPEVTEVATIIEPASVNLVIEPAPWMQTPRENIFDPKDNIFDRASTPLEELSAISNGEVAAPTTTVALEPSLRQRPPYRPMARNHRALGSHHKSVTPDPVDEGIVANVLEKLFGVDVSAESAEPIANNISDRIVAEEKLDLGYISPDAPDPANELTNIGDGPLLDQDLYLGRGKLIGQPYKRANNKSAACIERELHGSVFCLEGLDWPARDAKNFDADTAFIMPGEAIIRYENGLSSRVYAVFNASQFADVVKIMQRRFGPPQEREIGWMHILEAPKLPNTTFRWKAVTPDRADTVVLEVRNYDDIRRSFADMDHGMVRLFRTGSRPIFKHISTMDLMLMQRRSAAQASSDVKSPQK